MYLIAFIIGILSKKNIFSMFFSIYFLFFNWKKALGLFLMLSLGWGNFLFHERFLYPSLNLSQSLHQYQGKVLSFSQTYTKVDKYLIKLEKVDGSPMRGKLWLLLKHSNRPLYPGEVYQWKGKVQFQQDFYNPGLENFWYLQSDRHIWGTSFCLTSPKKLADIAAWNLLDRLRVYIYKLAYRDFTNEFSRSIFLTLILGDGA